MESLRLEHDTPRERGRCHGEHWRASIAARVEGVVPADDAQLAAVAAHAPAVAEELQGIAEGADVAVALVLALDAGAVEQSLVYCHGDEGPLLGQTWWTDVDTQLVEHAALGPAPAAVVLGGPGELGWTGINAHGLAVGGARLHAEVDPRGLTAGAVVRRLLLESTAADARRVLRTLPLAAGHFVVLADGTHYLGLECTPTHRIDTQSGPRAAHVHTNHCFDPVLRRTEQLPAGSTSFARLNTISTLYAQQRPRTADALWDLLAAEAGAGAGSLIAIADGRLVARGIDGTAARRTVVAQRR